MNLPKSTVRRFIKQLRPPEHPPEETSHAPETSHGQRGHDYPHQNPLPLTSTLIGLTRGWKHLPFRSPVCTVQSVDMGVPSEISIAPSFPGLRSIIIPPGYVAPTTRGDRRDSDMRPVFFRPNNNNRWHSSRFYIVGLSSLRAVAPRPYGPSAVLFIDLNHFSWMISTGNILWTF